MKHSTIFTRQKYSLMFVGIIRKKSLTLYHSKTCMTMKRLLTLTLVVLLGAAMFAQKFPANIYSGLHGDFHVQGIAYDHQRRCVYLSVTTALLKLDLEGNLLASMTGLTGHMGSIGINPDDGRLYGSLEYKHDVIGDNISRHLGIKNDTRTGYYIAVIDLDKFTRVDMTTDEVMTTVYIRGVGRRERQGYQQQP